MVLAAGAAQVDGVAFGGDILQGPDPAVEFRGFLQVVDAQLDAAQAVNSGVGHGRVSTKQDNPASDSTGPAVPPAPKRQFIANRQQARQPRRLCIPDSRARWLL